MLNDATRSSIQLSACHDECQEKRYFVWISDSQFVWISDNAACFRAAPEASTVPGSLDGTTKQAAENYATPDFGCSTAAVCA
jgi:hypothetical protein